VGHDPTLSCQHSGNVGAFHRYFTRPHFVISLLCTIFILYVISIYSEPARAAEVTCVSEYALFTPSNLPPGFFRYSLLWT